MSQPAPAVRDLGRAAAVRPTRGGRRPLGTAEVAITGGSLAGWQARNRGATVAHVVEQLRLAGNLDNLRRIAEPNGPAATEPFRGRYPFLDTDVFKTLEGLAYELARDGASGYVASHGGASRDDAAGDEASVREFYEEAVDLIERAQRDDGYLNSHFQAPDIEREPWSDLAWGHELYNLGHLIQAAVAANRQLGDDRLLRVAIAFADLAVERFGPDGDPQVCGHPEVEMALVELTRETGDERYLELASLFVDRRGHGTVELKIFPAEYFQDAAPLRELDSVTGHAVRMAYLAAGAADIALERGDAGLLGALERLWDDMVATKLYVTGGLGSRHSDEAIGDRFELPSERSYSETCAAIAVMQWAWRMYLADGQAKYLDVFETVLYNAYAVGISDDGRAFFYDNPLQRRPDHQQRTGAETHGELLRRGWFVCPCCPPNIIRWTAQLQDHVAALVDGELQLAQYATGRIEVDGLALEVETEYPWDAAVRIRVEAAGEDAPRLALRVPGWCRGATVTVNGERLGGDGRTVAPGWVRIDRALAAGDVIELDLPIPARALGADPRVDALRASAAVVRGPIVYCAEQVDQAADLDLVVLDPAAVREASADVDPITANTDPSTRTLRVIAGAVAAPTGGLYPEFGAADGADAADGAGAAGARTPTELRLVPYHLWGNRGADAMRVWLRTA
ncbi:glycoside hydrolase family 127 protein [Agromyces sp. CFH 90414]|uniref:Glycoside hydrolase family 127 protein n=1 Tax=Agromyces agglutinans TaxID=2662258 RepID=A0A6I2F1G5_9MICO|nr:beta-L-arabinofuranosidase domain-containing protein [Agromyces agglutinans]MRG59315.1 glycoside hydrolase family 127 protein [Agromyces agglutinans]